MSLLLASLVVVVFAILLERMRVAARAAKAKGKATHGITILRDPELDDDAKGRALRQNAVELFRLTGQILLLSAVALVVPIGAIWLLDRIGLASYSEVTGILERLDFLVAAAVIGSGVFFASRSISRR